MANNCLVTKLKSVVNNSNLPKLGEFLINCSTTRCGGTTTEAMRRIWLRAQDGKTITITAEGKEFVDMGTGQTYTTYTGIGNAPGRPFAFPDGEYNIHISSMYDIQGINNVDDVSIDTYGTAPSNFFYINIDNLYTSLSAIHWQLILANGTIKADLNNCRDIWMSWGDSSYPIQNQTLDLSLLTNNTLLTTFKADEVKSNVFGDIAVFGNKLFFYNIVAVHSTIYGSLDAMLATQVANGRTDGTLVAAIWGGNITYQGTQITKEWIDQKCIEEGGTPTGMHYIYADFGSQYTGGYQLRFTE